MFRLANVYYRGVREAMRQQMPEAEQVFNMLQLFWQRPRRTSGEPTQPEVMRDVRVLLRGTKDGEVVIRNESDQIVKGEKVVVDNTYKAGKTQRAEIRAQSEEVV